MNRKRNPVCAARGIALGVMVLCFAWLAPKALPAAPGTAGAAKANLFDLPDNTERLCISLRVLSERVSKALSENIRLPEEIRTLYGIGYLEGFIVDQTGRKDVILVGRKSADRPCLHLDDLIVTMREAGGMGPPPYCSLDPHPRDVQALQTLFAGQQHLQSLQDTREFFQKLPSAIGPQQIVVGGVPRTSRYAHVMIDADYHMKKVSQGHIRLPQFMSYLDRALEESKTNLLNGRSAPTTGVNMSRFWFHVDVNCPTYQESRGIVWIEKCPVVVLTEKQMMTSSGQLYDAAENDPLAVAFAEDFSDQFTKLTQTVPVYADLENLFRLRALLLAIRHHGSFRTIGRNLHSYIPEYRYLGESPMDSALPGLANYREWTYRVTDRNMIYEYSLFPIICGGVGMDMEVTAERFGHADSARLFSFRTAVLERRPWENSLVWRIFVAEL